MKTDAPIKSASGQGWVKDPTVPPAKPPKAPSSWSSIRVPIPDPKACNLLMTTTFMPSKTTVRPMIKLRKTMRRIPRPISGDISHASQDGLAHGFDHGVRLRFCLPWYYGTYRGAICCGEGPVKIAATRVLVRISMTWTFFSGGLVTYRKCPTSAMCCALPPTSMSWTTLYCLRSITVMLPDLIFATYNRSGVAMGVMGRLPTGISTWRLQNVFLKRVFR